MAAKTTPEEAITTATPVSAAAAEPAAPPVFRPGLEGVPATQSAICDIDGQRGVLTYRGCRWISSPAGAVSWRRPIC